ncbi:MAG: hypothetical protein NTY77_02230 [Elusimicrobia bacterium]|nr:hypothetical protein [Elusimicrobiota bacterium]
MAQTSRGSTLLELLIVTSVIAILAPIAMPKVAAAVPAAPAAVAPASPKAAVQPAAKAAASSAARPEVAASSAATVGGIYTVERLRDPFARWGASRGSARAFSLQDFSIHKLYLRGIMRDAGTDFALFVDNDAGTGFLLRQGRLYDPKQKPIPGVGGTVNLRRRMVTLTAPEGDAQAFQLGEEEKD